MPNLNGFVDVRTREPKISLITLAGTRFTCLIDTGFTKQLFMGSDFASKLGVQVSQGPGTIIYLADESELLVKDAWLDIQWVSGPHRAHVYVYPADAPATEVLLGDELLHPSTLEITYRNDSLEIRP